MFRVASGLILLVILAMAVSVHGHDARIVGGALFWLVLIGLVIGRTLWLRHAQGPDDGDR